jgi:leukotriene-A4 hydrolase
MAHSWSGNLVSCKSWEHFWLNEGLTKFLEDEMLRRIEGDDKYFLKIKQENDELIATINKFGLNNAYTMLNTKLRHNDPDDAFSIIPYVKGS